MKRVNESLEVFYRGMGLDELIQHREILERHYKEKASVVSEQFFTLGRDIFVTHLLPRLTREWSLGELSKLFLVSRTFLEWIKNGAKHLNLGKNHWTGSVYQALLQRVFPNVISIKSHRKILCEPQPVFSRLESLVISNSPDDERIKSKLSLDMFTSLKTLKLPRLNVLPYQFCGLGKLTQLTRLKCNFESLNCLLKELPNLTRLYARGAHAMIDFAYFLPNLKHLKSDHPTHYLSFTGDGRLTGSFVWDEEDFYSEKIEKMLEVLRHSPDHIDLTAKWVDGIIVEGDGIVQWDEPDDIRITMFGSIVNGKFEGLDVEQEVSDPCYNESPCSKGGWKAGVKHGLIKCYTWEGWRREDDSNLTLVREEEWCEGKLVRILDPVVLEK